MLVCPLVALWKASMDSMPHRFPNLVFGFLACQPGVQVGECVTILLQWRHWWRRGRRRRHACSRFNVQALVLLAFKPTSTPIRTYMSVHTYMSKVRKYIHLCMLHACIHTYKHTNIHSYIQTYTKTHTHRVTHT